MCARKGRERLNAGGRGFFVRVLVTGANGYIGRHVVRELLSENVEVVAADQFFENPDSRADNRITDIFADSDDLFRRLGEPDVCIHLAWKDGFMHNSDSHMESLSSHYRFIRSMIKSGLKQIAVMGSMHEVGYWEGAIDENTPCNPQSMYGIAKDALRRALFQMTAGTDVKVQWLRGFYIFGDDDRSSSIFGKIVAAEQRGEKTFPFTTGKNKYDFISVQELARQIAYCATQTEVDGIINCCTGKPVSLAEQVESFIRDRHLQIRLQYGAFPDRPYDSPAIWGDPEKINRIMRAHRPG